MLMNQNARMNEETHTNVKSNKCDNDDDNRTKPSLYRFHIVLWKRCTKDISSDIKRQGAQPSQRNHQRIGIKNNWHLVDRHVREYMCMSAFSV